VARTLTRLWDWTRRDGRLHLGSQDGFQLIEVMVSALLLGLIAIATFTGIQAVNASNANSRFRTEAELLAAQSQEHLRTDPVTALEKLASESIIYSVTVDGTRYTVTQSAKQLNGSGVSSACTVTERTSHTAPNYQVTSAVIWHGVQGGVPVAESSIVTPAVGSSLEVDIENAPTPTAGVSGVTVAVSYTSEESGSTVKLEGTTGAAGCIVFTGIRATTASITVEETQNFVTTSGALKVPPTEVTIAPNLTTPWATVYNEGGAVKAHFTYEGKTEYKGQKVTGDTFVVANEESTAVPKFAVGSTSFVEPFESANEEPYAVKTSNYQQQGYTAKGAKYLTGDLFPFPSAWSAYAGDCEENEPLLVTGSKVSPGKGVVSAGGTREIEVPMSYVTLKLYEGTLKKHTLLTTSAKAYEVKITNTACSQAIPAEPTPTHATGVAYAHVQKTNGSAVLENPFQPFGKAEICLQNGTRVDKATYNNTTVAGSTVSFYLGEETATEKQSTRKKEEEATKAKRLEEEAPAKTAREKEEGVEKKAAEEEVTSKAARETSEAADKKAAEAEVTSKAAREKEEAAEKKVKEEEPTTKSKRETEEKTNKEKWEKEEKEKKVSKAQRETKEKEQKTSREASEAKEKATKEKREKEEKADSEKKTAEEAAKTTRTKEEKTNSEKKTAEEAAKTTRTKEEKTTKETREKEEATATKREKEEKTAREAREKEEAEEATLLAKEGLKIESGATC
jgi:Tfp pilus assembly protein PilV/DNA segregation ATPase FtsK/SpoIIIE-like protein